jgi:hypothetical protein
MIIAEEMMVVEKRVRRWRKKWVQRNKWMGD